MIAQSIFTLTIPEMASWNALSISSPSKRLILFKSAGIVKSGATNPTMSGRFRNEVFKVFNEMFCFKAAFLTELIVFVLCLIATKCSLLYKLRLL